MKNDLNIGIKAVALGTIILALPCLAMAADDTLLAEYRKVEKEYHDADSKGLSKPAFLQKGAIVDDYINYSFLSNQDLRSSFEHWSAAMEAASQAGYYDEPVLSFKKTADEVDLDYSIELAQPVPWYGKRRLRRQIGLAEAEAAMHDYNALKSDVYMMVVSAFNDYLYLAHVIDVTAENMQLLSDLEKVIQAKYEASAVEFSDLIKVQVEIDKLKNELATLQEMRLVKSSMFSALLDLDTEGMLPWPKAQPRGSASLPEDVLFELLRELNPELKSMDAIVERDEYAGKLAKKSRYPDFAVGVGWMVMPENEAGEQKTDASLMLGVRLPLWRGKYSSEIREAEAMRRSSEASRKKLVQGLKVELRTAIFQAKDAGRRIELFEKSLIPKGQQALDVAMNDYSAGKVGFMTLIDAQRMLLEFRILREQALADKEKALAEIGCCVGKFSSPLDFLKDAGRTKSGS